jgi:hypothetical protein
MMLPLSWIDLWALQKIQMENLAKVFWMQHSHSVPVSYPVSDEGVQVWLLAGSHKLSSIPSSICFDHIHGKMLLTPAGSMSLTSSNSHPVMLVDESTGMFVLLPSSL